MNFKLRIATIVLVSLFVIFSSVFFVFSRSTLKSAENFEVEDVKSEVSFAHKTLTREADSLKVFLYDWGFWNETYDFLLGKNKKEFVEINLTKDFLLKMPNTYIAFINTKGKIFYSVYVDHEKKTLPPTPEYITDFIVNNAAKIKNKIGPVVLDSKIYFIGTQEVFKSDFTGPPTGIMVIMRDYKPSIFENKRPGQLTLNLRPAELVTDKSPLKVGNDDIVVNESIKDIMDNPTIINTATLHRTMHLGATKMLTNLFAIMAIFAAILSISILYIINKLLRLQTKFFHTNRLASIGILGAGIAHELNNPLTVIGGFAQNIDDEIKAKRVSNKEVNDSVQKILSHVNRMKQIIDQIRVFSRNAATSAGRLKDEDVNSMIIDSTSLFRKQFEVHGIEFSMDLGKQLPKIYVDRTKVESVIQNMIANAKDELDQTPSNKKKYVKISSMIAANGRSLSVSVTDNGRGVPAKMHKHIFDPFYTTKAPGKGTGLGLAIAYGIMEDLGGSIKIESEVNKGATFTINFPIAQKRPKGEK